MPCESGSSVQDYTILCFHLSLLFSECSVGTYSEGLGEECVVCPPNSEATQTRLAECTCIPVYYRALDEGPSVACTRECSTSNQCSQFQNFPLEEMWC